MAVRPPFRAAMLAFVLPALLAGTASAQAPSPPPAPGAPATGAASAATGPGSGAGTGTGTGTATGAAASAANLHPQGYGYGDTKPARGTSTKHRGVSRAAGPVATLPGFEMLPDGGSRFFVEMTQNVPVEEKKAAGTITYILKGEHVAKMNNENALVTVHFNTPVNRARLLPFGRDLHFILELRANVAPTFKVVPAKDGAAILQIEFPKGTFLPSGDADTAIPAPKDPAADSGADPGADPPAAPAARPRSSTKAGRRKH